MFFVVLLLGAISLFYVWLKWNYSYWKRNKVPGPEPKWFVGNLGSILNMSEHFAIVASNWYNEYPDQPYVGYYKMLKPSILIRDPDLLKDVLLTHFNSFRNNDVVISSRYDALTATNPFFKDDDEWRDARKTISPMLSQSKLKVSLNVMNSVAADFVKFIKSHDANEELPAKEISTRFTTENVIKCLFSIDAGCFNKLDVSNEFMNVSKELFVPSLAVGLKTLAALLLPKVVIEHLPIPFLPSSIDRWFRMMVRSNKASRTKDFQSNDFFQTLLQIQEKNNYDDTFLAGHSLSLFFDGTETSAAALSFVMYELARNPDCQIKIYDEVKKVLSKYDGEVTYGGIQEMNYLECVLNEAIRIHPPALSMVKLCTKSYTLPKLSTQSEPITIQPGTPVQIPILGIHMDPKYYPNPEDFQPERFSEEEQRNRQKFTFLTFGDGNRACLGMRFAMLQIKVALVYLALNFNMKLSPNQKPIVIDPQSLISTPKDGIWIRFERRN